MKIRNCIKILFLIVCALLCTSAIIACSSPDQSAKAAAIADLALNYAQIKGAISPEDAAFVREAKTIVLAPAPAEPPLPVVAESGK